jgi:hypothetical protein
MTDDPKPPDLEVHHDDNAGLADSASVVMVRLTAEAEVTSVDSFGLEITHTYKITAAKLDTDYHFELRDSEGERLTSGVGNSLADVFLGMATYMEENQR